MSWAQFLGVDHRVFVLIRSTRRAAFARPERAGASNAEARRRLLSQPVLGARTRDARRMDHNQRHLCGELLIALRQAGFQARGELH